VSYNPKYRSTDAGFSVVTFYLNACIHLEIWMVDEDLNSILWVMCTPRLLFSGHSELLPWNKAAGACGWPLTST